MSLSALKSIEYQHNTVKNLTSWFFKTLCGPLAKIDHQYLLVFTARNAPDQDSEWESKTLHTHNKSTFITSIKWNTGSSCKPFSNVRFYRNSRGNFFYWIIWRHPRTPSLIPPLRESVWLVVRCVDVWCSSMCTVSHNTVTWRARLARESEKIGYLWLAVLPAHSAGCDGCGEVLSADGCCGQETGPWSELVVCSHGPQRRHEDNPKRKSQQRPAAL